MFKQMEDKHKRTVDQLKGRVKGLEKDNTDLSEQLKVLKRPARHCWTQISHLSGIS
jgi:hypothetical protein